MRQRDSYSSLGLIVLLGAALMVGVPVLQAMRTATPAPRGAAVSVAQPASPASPALPTAEPLAIFLPTPAPTATSQPPTASSPLPAATPTPFGCKANIWALPVRNETYKVVGTFGNKAGDSKYVQGLKAVGGVTQTADSIFHPGIDLRARMYSPVYAVANATIKEVGYNGQYGKHVLMLLTQHPASSEATEVITETLYGHLSDIFVEPGQHVWCGQVIGISGNTGVATLGPHLHFEVRRNSKPINPQVLLDSLYAKSEVKRQ